MRRFLAGFIDLNVFVFGIMFVIFSVISILTKIGIAANWLQIIVAILTSSFLFSVALANAAVYYFLGNTPGKALLRLRVIKYKNIPLTFKEYFYRNLYLLYFYGLETPLKIGLFFTVPFFGFILRRTQDSLRRDDQSYDEKRHYSVVHRSQIPQSVTPSDHIKMYLPLPDLPLPLSHKQSPPKVVIQPKYDALLTLKIIFISALTIFSLSIFVLIY